MSPVSSRPVSAAVLDAAIAWQLCLDSGEASEQQRHDFADWLAQEGIVSISLNPDSVIATWQQLAAG